MKVVTELRQKHELSLLLEISGVKSSTYYYNISKIDKDEKNRELISRIEEIFAEHKGMYGYRRITKQLKNEGWKVNHKKVQRLMKKQDLESMQRKKRKYSSYKGTVGKIAEDLIKRDFNAEKANEKWFTDVTEFRLKDEKCYLSPIMDAYGQEIISWNISISPNLSQVHDMLKKAYSSNPDVSGTILHSDQGWQYQHNSYVKSLKEHGIRQSMSRKGNSMDNGLMENFFGILKCEMFYGQEYRYNNIDELMKAIDEYIHYYNERRIKVKLKGQTPCNYRSLSL